MTGADARNAETPGRLADASRTDAVDQPGLSVLREAVAGARDVVADAREALPGGRGLRGDAIAGLNAALTSVPDGMASGLLVGVNPIYGLYACIAGPIAGGLTASTQRMIVATTSAAALGAGQALMTERFVREMPGVVDVDAKISSDLDDSEIEPPTSDPVFPFSPR
ncbi:MAG TPA: SulP family inorganic anion transporter [Candidatus Limnocylindrales bacterium]|nr:SulP family inorganic anion transporter [Candidatus Limnocylindrales bacterium]